MFRQRWMRNATEGILPWEGAPSKYDLLFNDANCGRGDWHERIEFMSSIY